jgi:hypothetical protein
MGDYGYVDGWCLFQNPIDRANDPSLGIACRLPSFHASVRRASVLLSSRPMRRE